MIWLKIMVLRDFRGQPIEGWPEAIGFEYCGIEGYSKLAAELYVAAMRRVVKENAMLAFYRHVVSGTMFGLYRVTRLGGGDEPHRFTEVYSPTFIQDTRGEIFDVIKTDEGIAHASVGGIPEADLLARLRLIDNDQA